MFSITFGNQAENGVGMQMIGEHIERGFDLEDLQSIASSFNDTRLHDISYNGCPAYVLVIKNAVPNVNEFFTEMAVLDHDKKCMFRGKVKNKLARYNLCFADFDQEPEYEKGKGRVINFNKLPHLSNLRKIVEDIVAKTKIDIKNMPAELNYYYDLDKCGIGFHGDAERKIVICARISLAQCTPMHFQWYYKSSPIGDRIIIDLEPGDIYVLSEKAIGNDWKKSSILTLRHATGCAKYTK